MRYSAVFWDIDGTIFQDEDPAGGFGSCPSIQDSAQAGYRRAEHILRMFGHKPPYNLKNLIMGLEEELPALHRERYSMEILASRVYERLGITEREEESLILADAFWGPRYRGWLFRGCADALAELHEAGVRMGVITNNAATGRMMRSALAGVGLGDFFSPVICSCDIGARKPEPEIFRAALNSFSHPPDDMREVLYIGDNPVADIKGAVECGWDAAFHVKSPCSAPAPEDAVLAFTDYRELTRLVLSYK